MSSYLWVSTVLPSYFLGRGTLYTLLRCLSLWTYGSRTEPWHPEGVFWFLPLASVLGQHFPTIWKIPGPQLATLLQILFSCHKPQMSLWGIFRKMYPGVGGEDLGFFCEDRHGSDREGRGQEPTSWLMAEEKQMGWEIVAQSIVTTMVLFLIFPCMISFGSLGYNILKYRDSLTWLFLAYTISSWSLVTRELISDPVSSLGSYLNVTQDPPES